MYTYNKYVYMYVCICVDSTGALGTTSTDYARSMAALYGQYRQCSAGVPCVFNSVLQCSSLNVIKYPQMSCNALQCVFLIVALLFCDHIADGSTGAPRTRK